LTPVSYPIPSDEECWMLMPQAGIALLAPGSVGSKHVVGSAPMLFLAEDLASLSSIAEALYDDAISCSRQEDVREEAGWDGCHLCEESGGSSIDVVLAGSGVVLVVEARVIAMPSLEDVM
jgi:hypothetical protein